MARRPHLYRASPTMQTTRSILAVFALLAPACAGGSLVVEKPADGATNQAVTDLWTRDVRRTAQTGDWILSRSYSMTGDLIIAATFGEKLSHASIYDAERGTIIEALAPVVREVPLERLIRRNHLVIVLRPAGLGDGERRASVARARSVVGAEFDLLGMLGAGADHRFYCSELVLWASRAPLATAALATGALVTPSELIDHGTVVYDSGPRDDPGVQRAALARRRARTARGGRLPERPGLEVDEQPVAHRPQHREVGELRAPLQHLHRVAAQRRGADADDAAHRHDVLALEALHLRVERDQRLRGPEHLRPAVRILVQGQEIRPPPVDGAREGRPHDRRDLVHPVVPGRVEPASGAQPRADGEVRGRQHGLEQLELLLEQDLHPAGALDRVLRHREPVGVQRHDRHPQLVHHELHPDLLDLVNALEQELVRMGPLVRRLL
jgi:hypothetical protein